MKQAFKYLPISWIDATIYEHLQEIVAIYPNKIALNDGSNQLTYQEVLDYVCTIAEKLQSVTSDEEPVIVLLENNVYFICAMLACLAVGRGYIPLDAGFAHARNKQIIRHSESKTLISKRSIAEAFMLDDSYQFIEFNRPVATQVVFDTKPTNLAYILYTSGSTGQPKGVFQNQRNLLHDVMQYINSAEISANDRLSLLYSPSVNGAIRDIYGALLTGASLYINNLPQHGLTSIPDFIIDNAITIYHSIPGIFRTGLAAKTTQQFVSVRLIYLAGDKIFKSDIELYKQIFSDDCRMYVGIGSTENATIYRQWFINKQTEIDDGIVPVGYAVEDRFMTLVNEARIVNEEGGIGEIQVRSQYCALGYWKDESLTHQNFIFHEDGSRTIKTGDWGIINDQGLLEFKGRRDGQVKINGFRIEIGEIEANLKIITGVADAAVLIRDMGGTNKLVAYLSLNGAISLEEVKQKLAQRLSNQMFPSFFYLLDKMPYLSNFKIDYQALKVIDKRYLESENKVKTQNKLISAGESLFIKERLLNLWCQYASYESFRNDLTWKMGGGSSLEAINFILKVEQEFGIAFPNSDLHEDMRPSGIEAQIRQFVDKGHDQSPADELIHVYAFPPLKGMIPETQAFLSTLGRYLPLTVIDYPKFETWKKEDIGLENIAKTIYQQSFEKGKIKIFIGHCSGDHLAFYWLNQLAKNYPLDGLHFFILDSWNVSHNFKGERQHRVDTFIKRIRHLGLWPTLKIAFDFRKARLINKLTNKDFEKLLNYNYAQSRVILECYPFKALNIKAHLLISAENAYSKDLGWQNYLPKLTSEAFPFMHSEMFKDNQEIVLKEVMDFIEEAKKDYDAKNALI